MTLFPRGSEVPPTDDTAGAGDDEEHGDPAVELKCHGERGQQNGSGDDDRVDHRCQHHHRTEALHLLGERHRNSDGDCTKNQDGDDDGDGREHDVLDVHAALALLLDSAVVHADDADRPQECSDEGRHEGERVVHVHGRSTEKYGAERDVHQAGDHHGSRVLHAVHLAGHHNEEQPETDEVVHHRKDDATQDRVHFHYFLRYASAPRSSSVAYARVQRERWNR